MAANLKNSSAKSRGRRASVTDSTTDTTDAEPASADVSVLSSDIAKLQLNTDAKIDDMKASIEASVKTQIAAMQASVQASLQAQAASVQASLQAVMELLKRKDEPAPSTVSTAASALPSTIPPPLGGGGGAPPDRAADALSSNPATSAAPGSAAPSTSAPPPLSSIQQASSASHSDARVAQAGQGAPPPDSSSEPSFESATKDLEDLEDVHISVRALPPPVPPNTGVNSHLPRPIDLYVHTDDYASISLPFRVQDPLDAVFSAPTAHFRDCDHTPTPDARPVRLKPMHASTARRSPTNDSADLRPSSGSDPPRHPSRPDPPSSLKPRARHAAHSSSLRAALCLSRASHPARRTQPLRPRSPVSRTAPRSMRAVRSSSARAARVTRAHTRRAVLPRRAAPTGRARATRHTTAAQRSATALYRARAAHLAPGSHVGGLHFPQRRATRQALSAARTAAAFSPPLNPRHALRRAYAPYASRRRRHCAAPSAARVARRAPSAAPPRGSPAFVGTALNYPMLSLRYPCGAQREVRDAGSCLTRHPSQALGAPRLAHFGASAGRA